MSTLIVYFSKYGQTEKIAWRLAKSIAHEQQSAKVMNAGDALQLNSLAAFDAVVIGSPIYASQHSRQVGQFIDRFRSELTQMHSAFFSVGAAAAGGEEGIAEATSCMEKFLKKCEFEPTRTAIFAGGLPYRQYNWFIRMMMKWIVWRKGGDTDTSRNYEYTDWEMVEDFGRSFVAELERRKPVGDTLIRQAGNHEVVK